MSILVKGMKKPNICYEIIDGEIKRCSFVNAYDDCVILREKGIWPGTTWAEQYSKCPLVEVPKPHGRLIDADAINLDYVVDMADDWEVAHEITNCMRYAPTVIEAEDE